MKKYAVLLLLTIFLAGCEKDFDNVIEIQNASYQVLSTSSFDSFTYSPMDSAITVKLKVNSSNEIKSIYFNIFSLDGKQTNEKPVQLLDNGNSVNRDSVAGDNIFSNIFGLSHFDPVGLYTIKFYISDVFNNTRQVAIQNFEYDNGQINKPPFIFNLVLPEAVDRGATFVFSVTVSDPNGLDDVEHVYFELFRPDNTQVTDQQGNTEFIMKDDGDTTHFGDEVAGDGIYSFKNSFSETAQLGSWYFEFHAIDRSSFLSNKMTQYVEVR